VGIVPVTEEMKMLCSRSEDWSGSEAGFEIDSSSAAHSEEPFYEPIGIGDHRAAVDFRKTNLDRPQTDRPTFDDQRPSKVELLLVEIQKADDSERTLQQGTGTWALVAEQKSVDLQQTRGTA
jgi:hypothetical protein